MDPMTPPTEPHARSGVACLSCGYDLVGVRIGDRCPECGTAVNQFASRHQTQGKAIASMVLGICAIIMSCMTYGVLGLPCGMIVFSIVGSP